MPPLGLEPGLQVMWHSLTAEFNIKAVSTVVQRQTMAALGERMVPMWAVETDGGKGEFHIIREQPYVLKRILRPDGEEVFLI